MRGPTSFFLATGLLLAGGLAASCDVGDAICTDQTVEEDRNDDCPYGPPGGPQKTKSESCEYGTREDCTVTFRDDVYPILIAPNFGEQSGGGCTIPACHGATGTGAVALVVAEAPTPEELYAALEGVVGDNGAPYIQEGADDAYFLCNVLGTIGGGSAMPPTAGLINEEAIAIVTEWVECGMKLDGGGVGGGGVGGGGEGGGGGDGPVGGAGGGL